MKMMKFLSFLTLLHMAVFLTFVLYKNVMLYSIFALMSIYWRYILVAMSLLSHSSIFSIVHCIHITFILIKTLNLFTFVLNHLLRPFIHGLNNFVFAKLLENNCREKPQLWDVFENVSLCTVQQQSIRILTVVLWEVFENVSFCTVQQQSIRILYSCAVGGI